MINKKFKVTMLLAFIVLAVGIGAVLIKQNIFTGYVNQVFISPNGDSKASSYQMFGSETTKDYDSVTSTARITDTSSLDVANVKLNTPHLNYVMPGKNRLVFEYSIESFDAYDNVFGEVELYDKNRDNQKITRVLTYKYKTVSFETVPKYETKCTVTGTLGNGTEEKTCSQVNIGTEQKEKVTWNNFNENTQLPKGNITLGVFTDVKAGDYIEWIPTLFGQRIQEWAEWQDSYNYGLALYYKLDETTGTTADNAIGTSAYDLTGLVNNWTIGILNNGYNPSVQLINTTYTDLGLSNAVTINMWVYPYAGAGNNRFVASTYDGANGFSFGLYTGNELHMNSFAGNPDGSCGNIMAPNTWQMITLTISPTTQKMYHNGTQCMTNTYSGTINSVSLKLLGRIGDINNYYRDGKIDEIGVWNRSLNATDILAIYNAGVGMTFSVNQAPSAPVWNSPVNKSATYLNSYFVNWTNSTDNEGDTLTYILEIDNNDTFLSLEYRNTSIVETATPTNAWITGLTSNEELHGRVRANDGSLNSSWAYITWNQTTPQTTTTLNTPADNANSTTATITFNCSASDDIANINNITLYIDGKGNYSTNPAAQTVSIQRVVTLAGSVHNWTCNATGSTTSQPATRSLTIDTVSLDLNTPSANFNSSTQVIDFNCTANSTAQLLNITLLIDDVSNYTLSASASMQSLRVNRTVADGTHNWTCLAFDVNQFNETATKRYFGVDSVDPVLNLTVYPSSPNVTAVVPLNISLNWTAVDSSIAYSWVSFAGVNYSAVGSGGSYGLNFGVNAGNNSIFVYANDSYGHLSRVGFNYSVYYLNYSASFNPSVFETAHEAFNLSLVVPSVYTFSSAYFVYNGTQYAAASAQAENRLNLSNSIVIPMVSSTLNTTFYWRVLFIGVELRTDNYSHQVSKTVAINISESCPANLTNVFNFDFKDETNLSVLNADSVDYLFEYGLEGNTSGFSLYGTLTNISKVAVCLNSTYPYYSVGYGELKYKKSGYTDRSYYIFENTRSAIPAINNTLYFLENALATSFQITAESSSLSPYAGHYLQLLRWYPSLNSYKVVEMGKTDESGSTVMRVKAEDVDYRIGLYETNGTLVKLAEPVRMVCLVSPCSYTLRVIPSDIDYISFESIQYSLDFTEATGMWLFTYSDASQATSTMNLTVYKDTGTGSVRICNTLGTGSVGAISCNTLGYNGTLRAEVYRAASPPVLLIQKLAQIGSNPFKSTYGLFISVLLAIPVMFLLVRVSPVAAVFGGIASLLPALYFGSINLSIFGGIIILGGIVAHFLKRIG